MNHILQTRILHACTYRVVWLFFSGQKFSPTSHFCDYLWKYMCYLSNFTQSWSQSFTDIPYMYNTCHALTCENSLQSTSTSSWPCALTCSVLTPRYQSKATLVGVIICVPAFRQFFSIKTLLSSNSQKFSPEDYFNYGSVLRFLSSDINIRHFGEELLIAFAVIFNLWLWIPMYMVRPDREHWPVTEWVDPLQNGWPDWGQLSSCTRISHQQLFGNTEKNIL